MNVRAQAALFVHELGTPGFWRRARKFAVAVAGVAGQLVVAGVVPAPWDTRIQLVLAVLTAAGVYQVQNERRLEPT